MQIDVLDDADAVGQRTAEVIAEAARAGTRRHGRAVLTFSGGSTPAAMLRVLGGMDVRWNATHIAQTDERVAPDGHEDRNWTMLTNSLLAAAAIPEALRHPMPVTADDLEAAARRYEGLLTTIAGVPPIADVVHLGLGADGHTASLVPGDPVLKVRDRFVALAGPYQGTRRMTLTYPAINASRLVVWQVTGADKAAALREALRGKGVPASRIRRRNVHVVASRDAAALLDI